MGETITDAIAQITALQGDITTVGGAIILVAVVVFGIRWVKAQFF